METMEAQFSLQRRGLKGNFRSATAHAARLLALLLTLALPAAVKALDFTYLINDSTITITGYTGSGGVVTIPGTIDGLPVTCIQNSAFFCNPSLTNIVIPNSVTSIGNDAFFNCIGLTSLTISNGLTSIGDSAFQYCISLTNVTIPNTVTNVGIGAFSYCSKLTSVSIPNCLTSISGMAFSHCISLTNVTMPISVTSIGDWAFYDCYSLTNITIPNNLTSIGDSAFENCTSLTNITIPNTVISVGINAFSHCSKLTAVVIPNGLTSIRASAFLGCISLTKVIIPNTVTNVGVWAFCNCTGLIDVTIPNNVISIGDGAFDGCTGLTNVTIPNSITSIGDYMFNGCTGLINVAIPNSVTSIGNWVFNGCTGLTNVTIPNSVTRIGNWAFSYCSSLSSVVIPTNITNIAYACFYDCVNLSHVTIPNSVISIGDWAFSYCSSLANIKIPDSVTNIGNFAFTDCSSLTIEVNALNPCYSSVDGVLFNKSQTILLQFPGGAAHDYRIPDTVTNFAFQNCIKLTSISIPDNITSIGCYAFAGCTGLTNITIPASVTTIEDYAFASCSSLAQVYFQGNAPSIGGSDVFYTADKVVIYYWLETTGWEPTFADRPTVPQNFTYTITNNTVTITGYTGTSGALTIPRMIEGLPVTSIGDSVFSSCTSLIKITIPPNVINIGNLAFYSCNNLTETYFQGNAPSLGNFVFDLDHITTVYYLPGTTGWEPIFGGRPTVRQDYTYTTNNGTITITGYSGPGGAVTIPSTIKGILVTSIGESSFMNSSLTSVTIPNSVTSIGDSAFAGCTSLTNVTIPNCANSIGNYTFYYCTNLSNITIPDGVKSIASYAFAGCSRLAGVYFLGDAPSIGAYIPWDANVTVYYLSGTTGWEIFGYCPTVELRLQDYTYTVNNNTINITGYTGCGSAVTIPGMINGLWVTSIGDRAFSGRANLISIRIPNSIAAIGDSAFSGCTNLTSINFQGNVPSTGISVFAGDENATICYLPGTTGWESTFGGRPTMRQDYTYSVDNGTITITGYIGSGRTAMIPSIIDGLPVSNIRDYAFYGAALTKVIIPRSVTNIGDAFYGCLGLESVYFQGDAPTIDFLTFIDATIYYLSDTTGWGSTFGGSPTVLWDPLVPFNYTITNSTITITTYIGYNGKVVIPSTINGMTVTGIGDSAFFNSTILTDVTIPKSVTNIGFGAFAYCTNLTAITVDGLNLSYSSVDGVLYNKKKTTLLEYPAGKTGSFTIPNSVTSIQNSAFSGCNLTSITIPNSVKIIGNGAFADCSSLTSISIPNSVTKIPYSAFSGCWNLLSITIPASVRSIEDYAFYNCSPKEIIFLGNAPAFNDPYSVFTGYGYSTIYHLPGKTGWPAYIADIGTVTRSSDYAISIDKGQVSIIRYLGSASVLSIPSNLSGLPVTSIANSAFINCTNLTSATIPSSITKIEDSAFKNCTSLSAITVVSSNAFYSSVNGVLFNKRHTMLLQYPAGKTGTEYTIPGIVTSFGSSAFAFCTNLTKIYFNGDAPSANGPVFEGAENATIYFISSTSGWGYWDYSWWNWGWIWASPYEGPPAIQQDFDYGVTNDTITLTGYGGPSPMKIPGEICGVPVTGFGINDGFYWRTSLTNITIPATIKNIGHRAFGECKDLVTISVSPQNTVYSSVDGVLFNKSQTTLIQCPPGKVGAYTIPNGVKKIKTEAFFSCPGLTGITIPNSVTNIEDGAFFTCAGLTNIIIPSKVSHFGVAVFADCTNLTAITVNAQNTNYCSVDGVLFNKNKTTLIECPASKIGDYTIPSSVTKIEGWAFYECTKLTNVTLPKGLKDIGAFAFYDCTALTDITIPGTVKSLGINAFWGCIGLTSLTIPNSVTNIGSWAFYYCTNLTNVFFQGNIPVLGEEVFGEDSNLTIYYYSGTKGWGPTFGGWPTVCIDVSRPTLTLLSPQAGLRASNTVYELTARGTSKDNFGVSNVLFRLGNGGWTSAETTNAWTNWSAILPLTPGTNTLQVCAVDTNANFSPTTKVNFVYIPLTPLWITNTGLGTLKPAYTNGQLLALDTPYTVTATGTGGYIFSNWTGSYFSESNVLKFTMKSNTVLSANFIPNPFAAIAGDYQGLFFDESKMTSSSNHGLPFNTEIMTEASSGAFFATVKTNGFYSGKLIQGTASYPFSGQFSPGGLTTIAATNSRLVAVLHLTSDNGGQINGTVASTAVWVQPVWYGPFLSTLNAVRNPYSTQNKAPLSGTYTMVIPGSAETGMQPGGFSVASVNASSLGAVTVNGYAADGSVINCGTILSHEGQWPLYAPLTGGGFLIGWQTLSRTNSSAVEGFVNWIRPSGTKLYPQGFNYQTTNVFGSVYTNQIPLLGFTNGTLTLTDGNLAIDLTNRLSLIKTNVTDLTKTNRLKMILTPATGLFTGSITNRATKKTIPFKGVLLQNENVGAGAFQGTNQTGEVFLYSE